MNVLLIGVLLGLFQAALPERPFPAWGRRNSGRGRPVDRNYYRQPVQVRQTYRAPFEPQNRDFSIRYSSNSIDPVASFSRGHVESHPLRLHDVTLKDASTDYDQGYVPLREAVEHIPIEGEMNILLRSASENQEDQTPFSRSQVEAFPSSFLPYPSGFDEETNSIVYSSFGDDVIEGPLIGFRGDVEAPPTSTNLNPYIYFRGPQSFSNNESQWHQPVSYFEEPSVYKSWNSHVPFRDAGFNEKVVCYFESWAVKRPKPMDFDIDDIDPFACTHLIYSFAGLDNDTLTLVALDHERDIIQGAYKSAVSLKGRNPNLKVLIAVGGWAEGGTKYSMMVSTKANRDAFVKSVLEFIKEHHFDGLDLDWEYPGATDRGGSHNDKENIAILAEQLQAEFAKREWLLTMAVPIARARIDEGYDIPRLSSALDFFNLMAYDLRGAWDGYADHHAPLGPRATDKYIHKELNLKDGVQLFVDYGAPKYKLVIGVPFYGRSYTLQNQENAEPGSKSNGVGMEGKYTQERGYVAYYEICMNQRNGGWKIKKDEIDGPYMSKGDEWIGYDDETYIESKVNFIKNEKLGGVMLWAIDLDDYLGVCGTRWPLLSTIRKVLHAPMTDYIETIIKSPSTVVEVTESPIRVTTETTQEPTYPSDTQQTPGTSLTGAIRVGDACTGSGTRGKQGDCKMYLACNQKAYIDRPCAAGLHWNDERKLCDWPNIAKCGSGGGGAVAPPTQAPDHQTYPEVEEAPHIQPIVSLESSPSAGPLSGDYMVVCYYTNWAWYRTGAGKYSPDDIDENICTHIVYGFAVLNSTTLEIKPHDSWADIENKFYEKVTALRSKGIKVSIAIGGWNDSEGDKYSRLVNNPLARANFTTHVIEFIQQHKFDGLDLDWEYPVCWQVNCNKGPASDKEAFAAFVKELSAAFKPRGLLLSAAVSPSKLVIDKGYDVPTLNANLDWIAVMTYDFHGHWDKKTGHVAPMYPHPSDDYDYFNMDFAIRYWIEKGAESRKIVLGMPLYGQAFTIKDRSNTGLNSPASKGTAGTYTKAAGFLAYYEICQHVKNGWTVVKDPEGRLGPYAYKGNQWVSYDDVDTIRRKSNYIREMGLGGGMVWALDLDDFRNLCGQGAHPLMKTIQSVLGPAIGSGTKITKVQPRPIIPQPEPEPEPPIDSGIGGGTKITPSSDEYKVVCYYTNWSWYRQGEGKYFPEDIDFNLCTHINYGFVVLDNDTLTLKPHDRWADIDNNFYTRVTEFKKKGVKVLVALGGWNDSKGSKYSKLANDLAARKRFNNHALTFIEKFGFDGLDLDWEYPKCWQVDCKKGPESDKHGFSEWIMELRELFDPLGLLLTAAVSPSYKVMKHAYDVPKVSQYLDFINVMTYDYFGHWDKMTGHVAPMYPHPEVAEDKFNTDYTINHWIELGADPKKLILGMPMYGQSFSLATTGNTGLNQKSYGGGEAGPYTRARGFLAYYEICYFINHNSWTVVRDPHGAMGPYAYKGNQWVGFDDIPQIKFKSEYVKAKGLGGAMIWALDLDDFKNRCGCESYPLLKTINRVLRNYEPAAQECPLLGGGSNLAAATPTPITHAPTQRRTTHRTTHAIAAKKPTRKPHMPEPHQKVEEVASVGVEGSTCVKGDFKRHSNCGKFYECYKEKFREVSCFTGYHWNGEMQRCRLPAQSQCTGTRVIPPTSSLVPKPPAYPIESPRPFVPDMHPGVVKVDGLFGKERDACQGGEFKNHESSCDKFFECLHGKLNRRSCFPGLHWNGKDRCTWPNKANCQVVTQKEKPYSTQATTRRAYPTQPTTRRTYPTQPTTKQYYTTKPTTRRTYTTQPTTRRSHPIGSYTTRQIVPYTKRTPYPTKQTTTTLKPSSSTNQWYEPWTPSTEPTTPAPTHPPGPLEIPGYKVVCYFTNWAWYRQGASKYRPENVDPELCTHIIYGFAVLDGNKLVIKPHDTWADFENKFYEKVTSLKALGIRILIGIGGWNDSKTDKYSRLVNNKNARKAFTVAVINFIADNNFDGLDLDWEYPVCWQVDCKKGPPSDKDGFSKWIKELSIAFKPRNWLLTAAISPSEKVIKQGYNVADLTKYLDFVNVMTYDYHGHWDKKTGHVAPMYHHEESSASEFNANYTIHYLIANGAKREKLILGMPMYGQAFSLKDTSNTGLNSPADKGQAGEFTRAAGFLAYYEICDRVRNKGYTVVKDPSGSIGPYAYRGNQWVGFDDVSMIRFKSEYVIKMGLGGGMIWALDLDDFNNRCQCEPHPLLRTINRVLRNYPAATVDCSVG